MNTARISTSVSALENFRRFQAELLGEDELIERLITPYQEESDNIRIQRGTDLHKYIETGNAGLMKLKWDMATVNSCIFDDDRMGESEMWISGNIGDAYVYAKADLVNGFDLTDFKTTSAGFEVDKLNDSYQWRLYLILSGCERFIYRVFEVSDSVPYKIFRSHRLPLYRYPAMMDDCLTLIRDFQTWAAGVPPVFDKITKPRAF